MIARLINWYRDRFIRAAFAQLEAGSGRPRRSTKLTPQYEKRRVRELRHARAKFQGASDVS